MNLRKRECLRMRFYFFLEGDNVLSAQINDCVQKVEINYENYDHLLRIIIFNNLRRTYGPRVATKN